MCRVIGQVALGEGWGAGVGKCLVLTHSLNFRERVIHFHNYLVCHICTTLTKFMDAGGTLCVLKYFNVNTQLLGSRSQKILTSQDINLTFTNKRIWNAQNPSPRTMRCNKAWLSSQIIIHAQLWRKSIVPDLLWRHSIVPHLLWDRHQFS